MTSPLWTETSAAAATGGHATGTWSAHGVSIDSRSIRPDDLFVAIEGPRMDGHDFVANALESGAAAAMISHRSNDIGDDLPLLEVPDTLDALRDLALAARARTQGKIIAVTGSVGKTNLRSAGGKCPVATNTTGSPTHCPVASFRIRRARIARRCSR